MSKLVKVAGIMALVSGIASTIMVGIAIKWFVEDCKKAGAAK